MIKRTIIILTCLLFFAMMASGQSHEIDSLETLLKNHLKADTARVNLLNVIAYKSYTFNSDKAASYAKQASDVSSKLNYPKGIAASLWVTGLITIKSDKKQALEYFRKALKIAQEIGDNTGVCDYMISIGNIYLLLGELKASNETLQRALRIASDIDNKPLIIKSRVNIALVTDRGGDPLEAAQQYQQAINMAEELNDSPTLAIIYSKLALIHRRQGNLFAALEYTLKSLQLNEKLNDRANVCKTMVTIAGIQYEQKDYNAALTTIKNALELSTQQKDSSQMSICLTNMGNIYLGMNNPEALDHFQKALAMSRRSRIDQTINILTNIGAIYTTRGDYNAAMVSYNEALALARKIGARSILGEVYAGMGNSYIKQKRYVQAEECIQKALQIAIETHYADLHKDCLRLLSKFFAENGNYKDAYTAHVQYKILYDSLFNEQNTRKVALLESSYKFAREKEVYELEKSGREVRIKNQQQTILLLVVISLLVLLLSIAIYWSDRLKKRVLTLEIKNINEELENNQKAMAVAKLKLVQNAERDMYAIKMLEDIGQCAVGAEHKNLNSLINTYKLQSHHSNWEEFETLFTKVNTSFWNNLNELYPTLTSNERKLCVFLKLNMSNKDIALITLQSEEALKKSRLRLRKKFELDRSTNLPAFIQSL